jgi:hypothetical protein
MNPALQALIQRREASLDRARAARQQFGFNSTQWRACMKLVGLYAVLVRAASRTIEEES